MAAGGTLTIHAATRPMLVAARLRKALEASGYTALDGDEPQQALETGFVVRRTSDGAGCTVHPEHAESFPERLASDLSRDLRCRVTCVLGAGELTAYELFAQGSLLEKLVVRAGQILEDFRSPLAEAVRAGADLAAMLRRTPGLDEADMGFTAAAASGRPMVLRFTPSCPTGSGAEIEIDPLLECPLCGAPMRAVEGRYGAFLGCVRFPDCRGTLTAGRAEAERARQG